MAGELRLGRESCRLNCYGKLGCWKNLLGIVGRGTIMKQYVWKTAIGLLWEEETFVGVLL